MKNKCLFGFFVILLTIMRIEEIKAVQNNVKNRELLTSEKEIDDLIEYLAGRERQQKILERQNAHSSQHHLNSNSEMTNFIETSSNTQERGLGCESFNKCSGKGTCQNGSCMCDEGYDYFDCSVNVLSKKKYNKF
jgi:hypothetical protein